MVDPQGLSTGEGAGFVVCLSDDLRGVVRVQEATISEDGWIVLEERIDMTMTSNEIRLRNLFPSPLARVPIF